MSDSGGDSDSGCDRRNLRNPSRWRMRKQEQQVGRHIWWYHCYYFCCFLQVAVVFVGGSTSSFPIRTTMTKRPLAFAQTQPTIPSYPYQSQRHMGRTKGLDPDIFENDDDDNDRLASKMKRKTVRKPAQSLIMGGEQSPPKKSPVSSDVSQWASSDDPQDDQDPIIEFQPFQNTSKQTNPKRRTLERLVDSLVDMFDDDFADRKDATKKKQNKNKQDDWDMSILLDRMKQLVTLGGETSNVMTDFQSIFLKTERFQKTSYRLVWVGSDDVISHIGTGLHKVPLARLQDVFLSLQTSPLYSQQQMVEVLEVIRVLGPFPNIRNTIQGQISKPKKKSKSTKITLTYTSVVDGTGKELIANKSSERTVPLRLLFADTEAIIATTDDDDQTDPWSDPSNLLLFVGEDELDERLEALRVL